MPSASPLPYSDVAPALLRAIYFSLRAICSAKFHEWPLGRLGSSLREIAADLSVQRWAKWLPGKIPNNNRHILQGIRGSTDSVDGLPRISRLCLEAYARANESASEVDDGSSVFIPSPLTILIDALAEPERPESEAYGFALARGLLFACYQVHTPAPNIPLGWKEITISDIQEIVESFRTYAVHSDNVHFSSSNPKRIALAHFLAMLGVFRIRFGTAGKEKVSRELAQASCLHFLESEDFLLRNPKRRDYEFRLYSNLQDFPDTQEIINALMGIPIPIRGASTVFFGGLQKSHRDSLVVSISGAAGSGKTSLALTLAATFAPFGTQCLYCTFEEDPETLRRRISGLIPQYFRYTTLPNASNFDWFSPVSLEATEVQSVDIFADRYLTVLR